MDRALGFEVIDNFTAPATPGADPEVEIVVHEHFAALIAGAAVPGQPDVGDETASRFATRILAKAILTLGPGTGPNRFATRLSNVLGSAVEAQGIDDGLIWPAASVVCLSVPRREIWRIGTSEVTINNKAHYGTKTVHQAANAYRAVVNAANHEKGMPISAIRRDDPGKVAAQPIYDAQPYLINKGGRWGYGAINGSPVPIKYIEKFELPPGPCSVIMSSSFPEVRPSLSETQHRLETLQREDPAALDRLWTMGTALSPGDKSMADLAYLRLSVA